MVLKLRAVEAIFVATSNLFVLRSFTHSTHTRAHAHTQINTLDFNIQNMDDKEDQSKGRAKMVVAVAIELKCPINLTKLTTAR